MENDFIKRFVHARKKAIECDFLKLNSIQRQAVMTTDGPILILAGAGSGKTTVLINKIANLIKYGRAANCEDIPAGVTEDDLEFLEEYIKNPSENGKMQRLCSVEPVEPWRIMAITFTNKAANELKERLEKMLGGKAEEVWALTFHSACVRVLRRDIDRLGFDRNFTIYDTADSERVMKDIIKDLNIEEKQFPPKVILGYINRAKDSLQSPAAFLKANGNDYRMSKIAAMYEEYQKRLKAANAVDFEDILLHAVTLLLSYEDVRQYYQKRFKYLLVDEYQDTNNLQYLFASTIAGGYKNICVVGDDDQSIYRFRGATIENILSFENQYKNAKVIRLEQNYRSTSNILNAANSVIKNNAGRKGKELWTENSDGDKLYLYEAYDDIDESRFVADKIISGVSGGMKYKDYAVLYRMNAQSNRLEEAFKRNGIPYRIIGGIRFFDRAEVKDMLAYLSVIRNPADELRLRRIINTPARGIGAKTLENAEYIAGREGKTLFEVLEKAQEYPELYKASVNIMRFTSLINSLRQAEETAGLSSLYDELMQRSGYVNMLKSKGDEESKGRLENIEELKSSILGYESETPEPSLSGFLDEVALFTDIERYDEQADAVVMMTIHSAKGLEFDEVFLVGAEEGIFPSQRSAYEPEELEEERRLCYVAITRAKKKLNITCAARRMLFGSTSMNRRSRFIEEIPKGYLEDGIKKDTPDIMKWEAAARIKKPVHKPKQIYRPDKYESQTNIELPDYKKGEAVTHKAFGNGMILSAQAMGGDMLLEIAFDSGTKRLMAKSASRYLKRI